MDIISLVQQAQKGNDSAFLSLIQVKREMFYRTAFAYVRNREDALDIVSETVYKAYLSLNKLRNPATFHTWFTRILINTAISYAKKNNKTVPIQEYCLAGQENDLKQVEKLDLHIAIDRLNPKEKTVIILTYFQGLTLQEVAEVLGCPLGTVKIRLHRALTRLREVMKEGCLNEPAYQLGKL